MSGFADDDPRYGSDSDDDAGHDQAFRPVAVAPDTMVRPPSSDWGNDPDSDRDSYPRSDRESFLASNPDSDRDIDRGSAGLIVPFLIGGAVTVAIGTYGRLHEPTLIAVNLAGFSGPLAAKTWMASGAAVLAIVQLLSALAMYGKLPDVHAPIWTDTLHRWTGRAAFLLAVPVAIHCLYAVGFQSYSPRVLIHSLLGCFFFGAFTAKMLILSRKGMPGWALPLFGGLVFTVLVGIWLTSSLWFFTTVGVKL